MFLKKKGLPSIEVRLPPEAAVQLQDGLTHYRQTVDGAFTGNVSSFVRYLIGSYAAATMRSVAGPDNGEEPNGPVHRKQSRPRRKVSKRKPANRPDNKLAVRLPGKPANRKRSSRPGKQTG